jgi:hypothetical protein
VRLGASLSVTNLRRPKSRRAGSCGAPEQTLQEHRRDGSFRADRHASALAHEGDGILTAHVLNAASLPP